MKRITLGLFLIIVVFLLTSCGPKKSNAAEIIKLNGLSLSDNIITVDLNQAESFSFSGRITVSMGATWDLFLDESGKSKVDNKVLNLTAGENRAFIIVRAEDGTTKVYPVIINNYTHQAIKINYQPVDSNFPETSNLSVTNINTYDETLTNHLPSLTLPGHQFIGWFYDEARTLSASPTDSLTTDLTLYAKWAYLKYKVKLIDGSSTEETELEYLTSITAPSVDEREGYTFKGWYLSLEDTDAISFPIEVTDDLELYAKWEEVHFLVKFVTNGDSTIPDEEIGYWSNLTNPETPLKKGHKFLGWYLASDLSGEKVTFPLSVRAPLTLYGAWEINQYLVSFVTNNDQNIDNLIVNYQTSISAPIELTKPEHKFEGWYNNPEMSGVPVQFPYLVEENITLYARWTFIKTMSEGLIFSLNDDGETYQVIGYQGEDAVVLVPETFNQKLVTRINASAFASNEYIYRIILPNSIVKIDARAFENCISLRSMILPNNLKVLEKQTFAGCDSLEYVYIGELIESIEGDVFSHDANLKMVTIKGNPLNVESSIFNQTSWSSLILVTDPTNVVAQIANDIYSITINQDFSYTIDNPTKLLDQWSALPPYYALYNALGDKTPRELNYNDFASELSTKTLEVAYSEELYYAIVHGFKPILKSGSTAELIYLRVKQILRTIIYQEMTVVEKLMAINDWLVHNVQYDHDLLELSISQPNAPHLHHYSSFYLDGVFKEGVAVCDGYAKAFHLLCAMEGITAERVVGDVVRGSSVIGHAWNKVLLDGEWHIVDSTWSDTQVSTTDDAFEALLHTYFLVPESAISTTHLEEAPVIYEVAQTSDYFYAYYYSQTFTIDDYTGDYYLDSVEELSKLLEAEQAKVASGRALEIYIGFDYGDSIIDEIQAAFNAYPQSFSIYESPLIFAKLGIIVLIGK